MFHLHMETSPLPVKGCKIEAYARHSGPLSREGSLLCRTYCDTGPLIFLSHPKDRPIQSPLMTRMRMQRIYSNPDPHGELLIELLIEILVTNLCVLQDIQPLNCLSKKASEGCMISL